MTGSVRRVIAVLAVLLKESASGSLVAKDEVLFRGKSRILRKVTSTNGTVVEQEWLNGQLRRTSSELEGTTDYAYDGFGRRSRITTERNGVRLSSLTTYDADGNAVSETVMSGGESRTLRRTLDKAGRVIREEMPDGSRLLFQYDLRGNLVLESGDAQRVAYAYDHRNRRISMTTWRDPFGQGEGDTTRWSYDECGRMVRKAYADGTHVDYTYDADSNELSRTSARGIVRTSSYDAAGRRVAVSYSDGTPSLSCAYDRAGRLVRVTDAAGTWTLAYDANGNCISESVPQVAGRVVSRIYDALNRPAGLSLGDGENADLETAFSYDALGRLASVASRENEVHFDYRTHGSEPAGWRWQRNGDQVAAVAVSRDAWDDVVGISFGNVGDMHRMDFRHDTAGRLDKAEFADGHSWLYGYDRLYQVVFAQRVETSTGTPVENGSFHYEYDGAGNRLSSQDGSTAARRHYASNSLNQYASIAATGVIPIRGRADEDASGAVTATVDGDATVYTPTRNGQDFAVDIPVDNSAGSVTAHIAVDAVKHDGTLDQELKRRLSGDYVVPAAVTETLSYDADGNMLSQDGWTYAWNGEDRLVAASKGTLRLEFAYDYLGRRFEKKVYRDDVLSAHSLFAYDGLRQIAEYDALNGNALRNAYLRRPHWHGGTAAAQWHRVLHP